MARTNVNLPALGEGVSEGTIARWLVNPGDRVQLYQALVEIETDKVNAELPSPVGGVVADILVPAGETVAPGTPICVVADEVEAEARSPAPVTEARYAPAAGGPPAENDAAPARAGGRGPGGSVTRADVLRLVEARSGTAPAPGAPPERRRQASAMRQRIAERLTRSWREAPHAWMLVECDATGLVALRASARGEFRAREGGDLTYLPFFIKAVVAGLRAHPTLNASWHPESGVVVHERIGLGIAVAVEDGLVVPVLPDADGMSVAGVARALLGIVERARSGRLSTQDLEGGTFTLNNTGALGSVASAPIINPPHAGIVTVEAIVPRPVAVGDGIAVRQRVNLCLSFDHRVADGLVAARFLQTVRGVVEAYRPGEPIY